MKALLELERIVTTQGNRIPPPPKQPRKVRRQRDREQLRQMKRTADGSDIQINQRGKIS